jgi:hypothetical protein
MKKDFLCIQDEKCGKKLREGWKALKSFFQKLKRYNKRLTDY